MEREINKDLHKNVSVRELNPALFTDTSSKSKVLEGPMQAHLPHLMQTEQKITELKSQLSMMAEHLGKLTQQFSEWVKGSQLRFDKLQQHMTKLEQNDQYIVQECSQKFSQINTRLGERKSVDAKIQEMVDRHNSVLKSFEMRLTQMQKLISDKEATLLATASALNEAKMEISRLKRL